MYREYSSGHLQAEGAFVVRINDLGENTISLSDDGSYVTVSDWKDPTHKDPTRVSLTAFPVSADRFRLGYSYRLSWGGSPEYRQAPSVPGVKLQYDARACTRLSGQERTAGRSADGVQTSALAALAGVGWIPSRCSGWSSTAATSTAARTRCPMC